MKILQVNATYNASSTGRNTWEMHEQLMDNGHSSYIAAPDIKEKNCYFYKIGNIWDWKFHALMSRILGLQGYFSVNATRRLLKWVDEIRPDVVLLGNLHGNYINVPMLLDYLGKNNIGVVIVLHDCWFFTGRCVHYYRNGCDGWRKECGICPKTVRGNKSWFFDRSRKMLKDKRNLFQNISKLAFVGVSDWITEEVSRSAIGNSASLCKRIYNWIDFNKFYKEPVKTYWEEIIPTDRFVVLGIAATWSESKNFSQYLRLARKVAKDMTILLVGDISTDVQLPSNVVNVRKTTSVDKLRECYNRADVYLNFSIEETFGKVSAEALACGTPVVCYHSTANGEIVGAGCGIAVAEGDFNGIVDAICTIRENGKEIYAETCIKFAHENFDKEMNISEYEKLFMELA